MCGNGTVEANEQCDGRDLAGQTCATVVNGSRGRLACDGRCRYDTSGCVTSSGDAEAGSVRQGTLDAGAGATGGGSDAGGSGASDAGATSDAGGTSGSGTSDAGSSLDQVRQFCVDYINMYRRMAGLEPLARGSEQQERCSDMGARMDSESGQAHGSAGSCPGLNGGQNTCPDVPVGGRYGTLRESLAHCIDQMWAEGEPPVSRSQCIEDSQGCFLDHGHYINMTHPDYNVVACGFYEKPDGSYWVNQNFGF